MNLWSHTISKPGKLVTYAVSSGGYTASRRFPTSGETASALTDQSGCSLCSTDSAASRPASAGRLRSTSTALPDA
jgi:hypothetical protein